MHPPSSTCRSYGQIAKSTNNELVFGSVGDSEGGNYNETRTYNSMGIVNNGTCVLKDLAVVAPLGSVLDLTLASPMASLIEISSVVVQIKVADECPPGNIYLAGSRVCEPCPMSKYSLHFSPNAECKPCPEGALCLGADQLETTRGWWRTGPSSDTFWECPVAEACAAEAEGLCGPGYSGVLCGVCLPGYVRRFGLCEDCDSVSYASLPLVVVSFVVIVSIVVVCLARSKRFAATFESISFGNEFKIYYATIQILGVYASVLSETLVPPLSQFFSALTTITQLGEFAGGLGLTCMSPAFGSFKARLLISTLTPIGVELCIWAVYFVRILMLKHERARTLRTHSSYALLLLYFALPSTSTIIFTTFSCTTDQLGENGETYLIADYSGTLCVYGVYRLLHHLQLVLSLYTVSCESNEYYRFFVPWGIISIAFYPVGMNLLYAVLLSKYHAAIQLEKGGGARTAISFLHAPFSQKCYWWEVVDSVCVTCHSSMPTVGMMCNIYFETASCNVHRRGVCS